MATELIDMMSGITAVGMNMEAELIRINPTEMQIKWNIPEGPGMGAYAGCIIIASSTALSQRHQPENGIRYIANADLQTAQPQNMIGGDRIYSWRVL